MDAPYPTAADAAKETAPAAPAEAYVSARPVLVTGSAGDDVAELARRLHAAGYDSPHYRGEKPMVLDDALMEIVRTFQREHGHDPSKPEPDSPHPALVGYGHQGAVDARTWELLGARLEVTR